MTRRIGSGMAMAAMTLALQMSGPGPAAAQTVPAAAAELSGQHPAEYYRRAAKLFEQGKKDEAVFVFYLGQLRYRTHLAAHPDLKKDGDPALFASLSEVVGRPINEYAFGDIPALAKTLEAVIAYDKANPDTFTPPAQFAAVHDGIAKGLEGMRAQILAQADQIRAQRTKNGLPNRN